MSEYQEKQKLLEKHKNGNRHEQKCGFVELFWNES